MWKSEPKKGTGKYSWSTLREEAKMYVVKMWSNVFYPPFSLLVLTILFQDGE